MLAEVNLQAKAFERVKCLLPSQTSCRSNLGHEQPLRIESAVCLPNERTSAWCCCSPQRKSTFDRCAADRPASPMVHSFATHTLVHLSTSRKPTQPLFLLNRTFGSVATRPRVLIVGNCRYGDQTRRHRQSAPLRGTGKASSRDGHPIKRRHHDTAIRWLSVRPASLHCGGPRPAAATSCSTRSQLARTVLVSGCSLPSMRS